MAVTAETRTSLIGLSVAMLGSAPGTDNLNAWVGELNDGATLEDLANNIAASDAFQNAYPAFLTNEEFATDFLGSVMGSEVSEELLGVAVGIVVGLLNDGMSRGALALAIVDALLAIDAAGDAHPAAAELGAAAAALANKVEVAEYYTLDARIADPSADAIAGVTSDDDTVAAAITAIDGDGDGVTEETGETFLLTGLRDSIVGTSGDDDIYAEPVVLGSGSTSQSLQPYDAIDGGAGVDTLFVYDIDDERGLEIDADQVSNVEHLIVNAQGSVTADLTEWDGLESVELERYSGDVDIAVEGASVTLGETAGGDVTIDGAGGVLSLTTGRGANVVNIATREHTVSVDISGTADSISISENSSGRLSSSLESVDASRFASLRVSSDALDTLNLASTYGAATVNYLGLTDLTVHVAAFGGRYDWDGDGYLETTEGSLTLIDYNPNDGSALESLSIEVNSSSQFALHSGVKDLSVSGSGSLNLQLDEYIDVAGWWVLENGDGTDDDVYVSAQYVIENPNYDDTLTSGVNSLKYWTTIDGTDTGAALTAANSSETGFMTAVAYADGRDDSETNWVTTSLRTITVSGEAGLTVNASGSAKLTTVDASASTGRNSFTLNATDDLTSITGGSGNDTVIIATGDLAVGGLNVNLGAGNDWYRTGAGLSESPLAANSSIDGGEGNDTLSMIDGAHSTEHTYVENGVDKSIYSGFEILDVGGGTGTYDFALLGVERIEASSSTSSDDDRVILENVAAGTAINASGSWRSGTEATNISIEYLLAERAVGSIDFGSTSVVDVNLTAIGNRDDKGATSTSAAVVNASSAVSMTLTLTAETQDIQGLIIDSSAFAGGTALTSDYENVISVDAIDLVNVMITGNAQLSFSNTATRTESIGGSNVEVNDIEYVDATANTAGVEVDVTTTLGRDSKVTLLGGEAADTLKGSHVDGIANVLRGNGGNDSLQGGNANDIFIGGAGADMLNSGSDEDEDGGSDEYHYFEASDSQVTFRGTVASGTDKIFNFADGDKILLSSDLIANGNNLVKSSAADASFVINSTDADTANTTNSLRLLIGNGNGFFETIDNLESTRHFAAVVHDSYWVEIGTTASRTWVLLDIDGDGDFDAENDMVIELEGTVDVGNISIDVIS